MARDGRGDHGSVETIGAEEMTEPKPCPFCGHVGVDIVETSTFRWRAAECRACGVIGPEVRIKTIGDGTKEEWEADAAEKAIEEWNKRA